MSTFATDIDLLHWEPNIFSDAASVAQLLLSGTGTLAGTTFTIGAGSLADAHITSEYAIVLGSPVSGSFPIFSVNSATQLTLSVLYDELYPLSGPGAPTAPGSGSNISFSIRTFWPQRKAVCDQLLEAAGISEANIAQIVNPETLRRPCVLGTLQMIYAGLAAASDAPERLTAHAEVYERLYRRAMRAAVIEIDRDGDGTVDARRSLSVVELRRG